MDEPNQKQSSRRYDAQFKADVIALVQSGKTIRELAGGPGIPAAHLTRKEWEQAKSFGSAYHIHIWNLATHPPTLYERSTAQVELHVPKDSNDGKWNTVEIPIGGNVSANWPRGHIVMAV